MLYVALRGSFFSTILRKKYTYIFELSSGTNFVRFFVVFLRNNYFVKRREVGDVWDVFSVDLFHYDVIRGMVFVTTYLRCNVCYLTLEKVIDLQGYCVQRITI